MSIADPDELWPKLEKRGEPEVRKQLAARVYGPKNIPIVEEWLRRQEEQRTQEEKSAAVGDKRSELRVAASVKNAAWVAAVAAVISVLMSVIALLVALAKN